MKPSTRLCSQALVVALIGLLTGGCFAAAPDATALSKLLQQTREQAGRLEALREQSLQNERSACQASEDADVALRQGISPAADQLAALATRAQVAHRQCQDARRAMASARSELEDVRAVMRQAAAQTAQCLARPPGACDALPLQGAWVLAQRGQASPGVPVTEAPGDEAVKTLLAEAAKAQGLVDVLRKKDADLYDVADGATANSLKLPRAEVASAAASSPFRQRVDEWGRDAQATPGEFKKALGRAQSAANEFVAQALKLQLCPSGDAACIQTRYASATAAQAELLQHQKTAEAARTRLETAGHGLSIVGDMAPAERALLGESTAWAKVNQQIAFRKLLDANPNVKSFFGGDAIGLSAGNADNSATIRYILENKEWIGSNRLTLIASAPVDKGRTTLVSRSADLDVFKDKASLGIVFQRTTPAFRADALNLVSDVAVGLTVARSQHSYLQESANPYTLETATRSHNDVSFSVRWAMLNPVAARKDMLILSYDRQRSYKDDASVTRCPSGKSVDADGNLLLPDAVTCLQGPLVPPKRDDANLIAAELRGHFTRADVSLKVKHSLRDDSTDVDLPIYLIRNLDDTKNNTPFSGGISLGWSKGTPGLKWGLFVSSPLSFSKPPRP